VEDHFKRLIVNRNWIWKNYLWMRDLGQSFVHEEKQVDSWDNILQCYWFFLSCLRCSTLKKCKNVWKNICATFDKW
jgi:hypothetical protein